MREVRRAGYAELRQVGGAGGAPLERSVPGVRLMLGSGASLVLRLR